MIVWQLDLQLPMKLVTFTTNVVRSNPAHGKVYLIQHYMTKFVNDRHDIAKKLLKVALNTITLNHNHCIVISKSGGGNEQWQIILSTTHHPQKFIPCSFFVYQQKAQYSQNTRHPFKSQLTVYYVFVKLQIMDDAPVTCNLRNLGHISLLAVP